MLPLFTTYVRKQKMETTIKAFRCDGLVYYCITMRGLEQLKYLLLTG